MPQVQCLSHYLRLSNTIVSTCIDWMQRTDLPIRGIVWREQVHHILNMTMQLAIMTHVDSVGGWMLSLKPNFLCCKLINDMFNVELLIMFPSCSLRKHFGISLSYLSICILCFLICYLRSFSRRQLLAMVLIH